MYKQLALVLALSAPLAIRAAPATETAPAKAAQAAPSADAFWPDAGKYPVTDEPYTATLRSVSLEDLKQRDLLPEGIYRGSPEMNARRAWYAENANFYATLAAKKVWHPGTGPSTHEMGGPITWDIVSIPMAPPPPCDQPQPTGYDAESCRYVNSLFKDIAKTDPEKARILRAQVRRGRDVWFKGTFGNQDEPYIHFARVAGGPQNIWYPWLDTRHRKERFAKWGVINDPDCTEGDASTDWWDKCPDPQSSGVLGYRKYYADPLKDSSGKVIFDPRTSPYRPDELQKNLRYVVGNPCVQCHVAFDPTRPPKNPNQPKWENISATIGNQYTVQPLMFFQGTPQDSVIRQVLRAGPPGTIDTSLVPNDFMNNPGTQNNIMDFQNRRVFTEMMKDPFTGKVSPGRTQHVLKGGEDSVGDHLALIRVYVNIGMCTEECWAPNFPEPGTFFGDKAYQHPFRIKQCARDCNAWNYADAKMDDLAAFLVTGGPDYLLAAKDVDGTPGSTFVDLKQVPRGHTVFSRECAVCHSSQVPPENIRADKDALERYYEGHVFGKEQYWQNEFTPAQRDSAEFKAKYLVRDDSGQLVPRQFAGKAVFGQDWLGNDEPTPFNVVGTNMCRALHDNHNEGHIFEEFSSEDFKQRPSPGSVPEDINRMFPLIGGVNVGERKIEGGPGYYRNISLLSVWATAPFLHNNALGHLSYLPDGGIDYTVRGRIKQFEDAYRLLMMSDDPNVDPHRPQKITVTDRDIKLSPREDQQGPIKLPVKKGTPIEYFSSSDPHHPLFMKCDDLVENKGHQFGINLSPDDKLALREFLKMM
ncbi:MAG: hypothetical protein ACRETM_01495 [Stenotrophobium sp.]